MGTIEPSRIIELLAEFGPHGAGEQPELAGVDLFEFFSGKDLGRADFSAIQHALTLRFRNSDMRQCVFRGSKLHGSSFAGSDLRGADFRDAQLSGNTAFVPGQSGGSLMSLDGARFDNAQIEHATFASVRLNRCGLVGASINATLTNVDLSWANLSGISLAGEVQSSDLTGVTGTDVELRGTWSKCVFDELYLPRARLGGHGHIVLADCTGQNVSLRHAALLDAELLQCTFAGVDLTGVSMRDAFIDGSDLSGAQLAGADLTGTQMDGGSLAGADLTGATVANVELTGVDLTGAVIDDRQLEELQLSVVTGR